MASLERSGPTRAQIISYAEDVILRGKSKAESYRSNIDANEKNLHYQISLLERRKDFKAVAEVLTQDNDRMLMEQAMEVRKKYLSLMGKNIDSASRLLDKAEKADKQEDTAKNTAMAVRLVNETITAMAAVGGAPMTASNSTQQLDPSGIVQ